MGQDAVRGTFSVLTLFWGKAVYTNKGQDAVRGIFSDLTLFWGKGVYTNTGQDAVRGIFSDLTLFWGKGVYTSKTWHAVEPLLKDHLFSQPILIFLYFIIPSPKSRPHLSLFSKSYFEKVNTDETVSV